MRHRVGAGIYVCQPNAHGVFGIFDLRNSSFTPSRFGVYKQLVSPNDFDSLSLRFFRGVQSTRLRHSTKASLFLKWDRKFVGIVVEMRRAMKLCKW